MFIKDLEKLFINCDILITEKQKYQAKFNELLNQFHDLQKENENNKMIFHTLQKKTNTLTTENHMLREKIISIQKQLASITDMLNLFQT